MALVEKARILEELNKHPFFVYDHECGYDEYKDMESALEEAKIRIEDYCEDGWGDEVEDIIVGLVTHRTKSCNHVTRDMLNEYGEYNGRYYGHEYEEYCDYEMEPVRVAKPAEPQQVQGNVS